MTLSTEQASQFRDAVEAAASRRDLREVVSRVYHDLQTQIDQRRPLCVASGKCCKFEAFGHRLFITTLEMAAFVSTWKQGTCSDEVLESVKTWDGSGCPFQVEKMCGVHLYRPFGCRIFFCDSSAGQWQQAQYEQFHSRLKSIHETLEIPYFYVEWRQALRAMGVAGQ